MLNIPKICIVILFLFSIVLGIKIKQIKAIYLNTNLVKKTNKLGITNSSTSSIS